MNKQGFDASATINCMSGRMCSMSMALMAMCRNSHHPSDFRCDLHDRFCGKRVTCTA